MTRKAVRILPTARLVRDRGPAHAHQVAPTPPARELPARFAARVLLGGSVQWWAWLTIWFVGIGTVDPPKDASTLPLIAITGAIVGAFLVRGRWRLVRLFRHGRETRGKFLWLREGDMPIEGIVPVEMAFEYLDAGGRTWRTRLWTRKPDVLRDEPTEPMLYDPEEPGRAVLLDALPFKLAIGDDKVELVDGIDGIALYLVAPLIAAAGCVLAAVFGIAAAAA